MTFITKAGPRYVQELGTILVFQNRTQGSFESFCERRWRMKEEEITF